MFAFGILATLGLIGWGVYYFNMNTSQEAAGFSDSTNLLQDSLSSSLLTDGLEETPQTNDDSAVTNNFNNATITDPGFFKFVVESTDNKLRALNRFGVLRLYGKNIQLETRDSILFKLFYSLPATTDDTLRIRDSLNQWYYGNTNTIRVTIEKQ